MSDTKIKTLDNTIGRKELLLIIEALKDSRQAKIIRAHKYVGTYASAQSYQRAKVLGDLANDLMEIEDI